jgi:type VI secretion system secreted protein VgrG
VTTPRSVPVGKTPAQPTRTAQPTPHKVPLQLDVVEPQPKTELKIDNGTRSTEPTMPKIKLKATVTVQGQPVSIGTIRWEFHVKGTYRVRITLSTYRMQPYDLPAGNVETAPGEEKEFTLAPELVVGGELVVKASYTGGAEVGGASVTKTVAGCKVTGQPLDRAESTAYIVSQAGSLAWLFLRMFYVETEMHPYQQFLNGMPWYGDPAGVGCVQRDPEPGEWTFPKDAVGTPNKLFPKIFWNWKRNVEEGIRYFNEVKLGYGRSDVASLRRAHPKLPDPPEALIDRAGIRRYNGGVEYSSADGLHYQAPAHAGKDYADKVVHASPPEAAPYPVPDDALVRVWPVDPPPAPGKKPKG